MVSSAIWEKHARVSFSKTIKIARVYVFPNCTRNHTIIYLHEETMQSHACAVNFNNINNFNRKSNKNASHFCKCLDFLSYFPLEMAVSYSQ